MGLENKIQDWVLNIAVKKGIKSLVKLLLSYATSVLVVSQLQKYGVDLQIEPGKLELGLTAVVNGGLEILRNYLKVKVGVKGI